MRSRREDKWSRKAFLGGAVSTIACLLPLVAQTRAEGTVASIVEESTDAEAAARADTARLDLESAREYLLEAEHPTRRVAAIGTLTRLLVELPEARDTILDLLREARLDESELVAHEAEISLAWQEGRPPDPAFLIAVPAPRSAFEKLVPELLRKLRAPAPATRYDAIEQVVEMAGSEEPSVPPEIEKSLRGLCEDSDPRVAYRAEYALKALAGDEKALGLVYEGDGRRPTD